MSQSISYDLIVYFDDLYYVNWMGWLCVLVLGVNDGIVLVGVLIVGVVVVNFGLDLILIVGVVGFVVGVLFMVMGEYVLVSL